MFLIIIIRGLAHHNLRQDQIKKKIYIIFYSVLQQSKLGFSEAIDQKRKESLAYNHIVQEFFLKFHDITEQEIREHK
ncbi:hypothetical protein pb186bvf_014420 [Paramecium bursaria]